MQAYNNHSKPEKLVSNLELVQCVILIAKMVILRPNYSHLGYANLIKGA